MYLIAGLGNPGGQYELTRHNVGFMVVDFLARAHGLSFSSSKWQADVARGTLWGEAVCLVKPMTFMNRSGTPVAGCARFFKVDDPRILVIHDDLDMAFGRLKLVARGGAGGHNGVRSLIENLGGDGFPRIKFGIGRPGPAMPAERYVLSRFSEDELAGVEERSAVIEKGIRVFLEKGSGAAMNFVNAFR